VCPGTTWTIQTTGSAPNTGQPLQSGQVWAGITYDNSFNAVCQH
jgi:hypothetical protein